MLKSRPFSVESSVQESQCKSSWHLQRLLDSVDDKDIGARMVDSYRDIFPGKFAELVKIQLSFLVDLPSDYLRDEIHVESSPLPATPSSYSSVEGKKWEAADAGAATPKASKPRLMKRLPLRRLLHSLNRHRPGRRDISDDSATDTVEMKCVCEEQVANFNQAIDFLLSQDNFAVEGIFRKSGSAVRQREVESLLCSSSPISPSDLHRRYSSHDVAAGLKMALLRLQEPLLTRRFAPLFGEVAQLSEERTDDFGRAVPFRPGDLELIGAKQVKAFRLLFLLLPDSNRHILLRLLDLLRRVIKRQETKMTADALGIIFAPAFFLGAAHGKSRDVSSNKYRQLARCAALMVDKGLDLGRVPSSVSSDVATNLARISKDPVNTCVRYAARKSGPGNSTEQAVAQLYAEVARWPESERKTRLVRRLSNFSGGLAPLRSPGIDLMHHAMAERASLRKRLFPLVGAHEDLPSLISFSEPLSPDEHLSRWTTPRSSPTTSTKASQRCADLACQGCCTPCQCRLPTPSERTPVLTQ